MGGIFRRLLTCALGGSVFLPSYTPYESNGDNFFVVSINGEEVGTVANQEILDEYLYTARASIVADSEDLMLIDYDVEVVGKEIPYGKTDSREEVIENIIGVLTDGIVKTMHRSYTVKINEQIVNLTSVDEVRSLLNAALDKYNTAGEYEVSLNLDPTRELNVLAAEVTPIVEEEEIIEEEEILTKAGLDAELNTIYKSIEPVSSINYSDYNVGIINVDYAESIEVVEAFLLDTEIMPVDNAIALLTAEQEKQQIYEVVSGDTLIKIANKHDLTVDEIVAMNPNISTANSTIRVGDEIVITVPEPELSVQWQEQVYYEESYEAPVEYVYNDTWYTTTEVTLQEPSSGYRKVVAVVTYRNDNETEREIIMQEVVSEAVPKIVEKGTIIPPTYIKPVSGGYVSSPFGWRKSPTKGASSYHKGVDWAVSTGTSVVASSGGVVTKAGWMSSYGYVIFIDHPDGRQTRYAHLSKIFVSVGDKVSQGTKIALSGNTGVSTGPHLHFEIIAGGKNVNPLNYLN